MSNKLFQQLNQTQSNTVAPQLQNIKNIASMLKGKSNPMQALQMLAGQNPQIGQVLTMLNNSGMSPKDLFMQQAQQKGVNPDEIIEMLKGI